MADELEPVTQVFKADFAEYIEEMKAAEDEASSWQRENTELEDSIRELADVIRENSSQLDDLTAEMKITGEETHSLGDTLLEVSADMGHLRDETLEAAEAMAKLRDEELEAAAAGNSVGGSGGGSNKNNVKRDAENAGEDAASGMEEGMEPLTSLIIAAVVTALAALPALFAVAGAAAAVGFGAMFLIETNKQVKSAATSMVATLKGVMTQATQPLIAPLEAAFKQIGQFAKQLEPELRDVFAASAPLVQPLVNALEGLISGVLPGLVDLLRAAKPAIDAFADGMEQLGGGLGAMMSILAQGIGPASTVLKSFFDIVADLLPVIGSIANLLGTVLAPIFSALATVVGILSPIVSDLAKQLGFALGPVAVLLGKTLSELGQAILPILGSSLAGIVAALTPVIAAFVTGLAPVLPPIIKALAEMATIFTGALTQALMAFVPGVVQILGVLSQLLVQVLVPLLPTLVQLFTAFMQLSMATLPLVGPLLQLAAVLLELATKILVPLVPLLIQGSSGMAGFMTHVAGVASVVATIIGTGITWISNIQNILSAFSRLGTVITGWGHSAESDFDAVVKAVSSVASAITSVLGAAVSWIASNWKAVLAWLVDPVGMAVLSIKENLKNIQTAFDDLRHDVSAILAGTRTDIANIYDNMRHDAAAVADYIPAEFVKGFDQARHDAASAADGTLKDIESAWNSIKSTTGTMISNVIAFFQKLPGQITSELAALPGQMITIGKNVIDGLINGIKDAAADIPGIMKSLASDVASYFTDPLKILSPSLVFYQHGVNIIRGLVQGIQGGDSTVQAAMNGIANTVASTKMVATGGVYGSAAAASSAQYGSASTSGGNGSVNINVDGQKLFTVMQSQLYRYNIRNSGVVTGVVRPGVSA